MFGGGKRSLKVGFVVHTCTTTPKLADTSVKMIESIMKE